MKTILIILYCLFVALVAGAQTNREIKTIQAGTQVQFLLESGKAKIAEQKQNRELAMQCAKLKGWPLVKKGINNGFSMLVGVTGNLQPIYATSLNWGAGLTTRANKLYSGGGLGLGIHGESMTVGIWDAPDVLLTHEIFENRAVKMDGPVNYLANHATHVAGTIIGSDQYEGGLVRGAAFKANLHAYDWYDDRGEARTAAANGLLVSNHSYYTTTLAGYSVWGGYDYSTTYWDTTMYYAPYYLVAWAAGNGGEWYGQPVEANRLVNEAANKNGITVGNIYEISNYTGPGDVVISPSSSRGPTYDGRIKPDVCAKGHAVNSSNNYTIINPSTGTFYTPYGYAWGTSMATAGVTGTLLLLQQYYVSLSGSSFMKSASLKGLAIHTADEAGLYPGPDYKFGWGVLNAEKAALIIGSNSQNSGITEATLNNNSTYTKVVTAAGNQPLVATLCWTDVPGAAIEYPYTDSSARLVNDLDIRITSGVNTNYPWKLNPADIQGAAIQGDNDRDNVEKIEIPNAVAGQAYTITITHKGTLNIPVGLSKQDFSLIVSGQQTCPSDVTITGTYAVPLTSSANWIKSAGQTTIQETATVKLDAAATGYVEMAPSAGTDFFYAAPTTGEFIAQPLDGCGVQEPMRGIQERPVKYFSIPATTTARIDVLRADKLTVLPNPTNGTFVLTAGRDITTSYIEAVDVSGKVQNISIENMGNYSKKIQFVNKTKGTYFIKVHSKAIVQTAKVVVF
ncbi:MAG: S8 family serine peptidase [Ferruginibacter sp.]|nr:S8 family serine peptidase [Ferruginibacter sp.]